MTQNNAVKHIAVDKIATLSISKILTIYRCILMILKSSSKNLIVETDVRCQGKE